MKGEVARWTERMNYTGKFAKTPQITSFQHILRHLYPNPAAFYSRRYWFAFESYLLPI